MKENNRHTEALKKIDAYLSGEMSEREFDEFWEWIFENPEFHRMLRLEANLRHVIRSENTGYGNYKDESGPPSVVNEPSVNPITTYRNWIIAAAAVLVLVIGINLLKISTPDAPAPGLAEQLDILPSIDLFELETVATFRGEEIDPGRELTELFDESTTAAIRGETEAAIELYDRIITEYPDDPLVGKAYMNAGILLYNEAEYPHSIEYFNGAVSNPVNDRFEQKAWWYKAHAEMNIENYSEARESMLAAYGIEGVYRREAFRYLRTLDQILGNTDFEELKPEIIDP